MVLFGLTFLPSSIDVATVGEVFSTLDDVPSSMAHLGEGALPINPKLYAWSWVRDERPNFKALQKGLLVAPILKELILNREPESVLAWADRVANWRFTRIIPCHLANDIKATPADFRRAFAFLEPLTLGATFGSTAMGMSKSSQLRPRKTSPTGGKATNGGAMATAEDSKLLREASKVLTKLRIVNPPASPVGGA